MLFGFGVVGVVATAVLSTRATLKLDEILKENEEKTEQAKTLREEKPEKYSEEDLTKDLKLLKVKLAVEICKLYAPAVISGVLTVGALTGSHVILSKRYAGVTAAYAALDKGFKDYRKRVAEEFGVEKERELRYDMVEKKIAVDTEEGPVPQTVKVPNNGRSPYARVFDENNPRWQRTPSYNMMLIKSVQQYMNELLIGRGHVLLNDAYEALGFERTSAGAVVGWVRDGNGDGYIDFGVFDDMFEGQRFVNGYEKSIWLDFNVDGLVYDLISES